jgi:prepilin-type N-terminal cleavage/methylation domain-containing protein
MKKLWAKPLKSFTLVELLLVLAIIALLASLVIIVLGRAKKKALDGGIKANLSQIRQEASAIYTESNSYVAPGNELCAADNTLNEDNISHPSLARIEEEVMKRNGQRPVICYATTDKFCVQSPLATEGNLCVDFTGRVTTTLTCSSSAFECL